MLSDYYQEPVQFKKALDEVHNVKSTYPNFGGVYGNMNSSVTNDPSNWAKERCLILYIHQNGIVIFYHT